MVHGACNDRLLKSPCSFVDVCRRYKQKGWQHAVSVYVCVSVAPSTSELLTDLHEMQYQNYVIGVHHISGAKSVNFLQLVIRRWKTRVFVGRERY